MTKETLLRAIEIKRNLESLEKLRRIMLTPHPDIGGSEHVCCLIGVGEEAEKDIKESIDKAIKRNRDLLEKELEAL